MVGLTGTESNPDSNGNPVVVHKLDDFTPDDPPHGWDASHAQFNGGANDGFVTEHAGASETDVMGYHVREQLPITYALADAYATAQLFLRVLQMARDRGILDVQSLVALQKRHVDNQLRPAIAPVGA